VQGSAHRIPLKTFLPLPIPTPDTSTITTGIHGVGRQVCIECQEDSDYDDSGT
jgi:hypothetical protein